MGIIEGIAEATALIVKVFSGVISDNHKPPGYVVSFNLAVSAAVPQRLVTRD